MESALGEAPSSSDDAREEVVAAAVEAWKCLLAEDIVSGRLAGALRSRQGG